MIIPVKFEVYYHKSELNKSGRLDAAISDLASLPNIEVRVKSSSTLAHMKAYQVDRRVLRTGSANFSAVAERRQDNDLVFICNQDVIDQFRTKFEQMWDRPDNEVLGSIH
jgi:phosphatidylserine/phosphatidylglycerophosphate/cardiolipin synthase-like enzyme